MFFTLSKLIDVLLSPLAWALGLVLASILAHQKTQARVIGAAALAVLYVFALEPISNRLVRHLELAVPRELHPGVTYDAVILLGGLVDHGATASYGLPSFNESTERLLTTFDLLRSSRARSVIISGGRGSPADPVVEARVLGTQLEAWGIDPSRILLEEAARNTRENATLSERIVSEHHFARLLLVTSAFHMQRAMECFRAVGLSVDPLPVDYRSFDPKGATLNLIPRAMSLANSEYALRELAGRFIYRAVGYGKP